MKNKKSISSDYKKKIKKLFTENKSKELTVKSITKRINFKGPSSQIYRLVKQLEHEKFLHEVARGKYSASRDGRKSKKTQRFRK